MHLYLHNEKLVLSFRGAPQSQREPGPKASQATRQPAASVICSGDHAIAVAERVCGLCVRDSQISGAIRTSALGLGELAGSSVHRELQSGIRDLVIEPHSRAAEPACITFPVTDVRMKKDAQRRRARRMYSLRSRSGLCCGRMTGGPCQGCPPPKAGASAASVMLFSSDAPLPATRADLRCSTPGLSSAPVHHDAENGEAGAPIFRAWS